MGFKSHTAQINHPAKPINLTPANDQSPTTNAGNTSIGEHSKEPSNEMPCHKPEQYSPDVKGDDKPLDEPISEVQSHKTETAVQEIVS